MAYSYIDHVREKMVKHYEELSMQTIMSEDTSSLYIELELVDLYILLVVDKMKSTSQDQNKNCMNVY